MIGNSGGKEISRNTSNVLSKMEAYGEITLASQRKLRIYDVERRLVNV